MTTPSTSDLPTPTNPPAVHEQPPVELERALPKERMAAGRAQRTVVRRSMHSSWTPAPSRPDPVSLLEESNRTRQQDLVPIRYGRMLASPFTYLRGSPIVMAHDLGQLPNTGICTQLCGDAHLMNFVLYARSRAEFALRHQ
jgi:hypothetical protein